VTRPDSPLYFKDFKPTRETGCPIRKRSSRSTLGWSLRVCCFSTTGSSEYRCCLQSGSGRPKSERLLRFTSCGITKQGAWLLSWCGTTAEGETRVFFWNSWDSTCSNSSPECGGRMCRSYLSLWP